MILDAVIERLNLWGDHCARVAWPLFWQSSILIAGMLFVDLFLRRRLRPSVRHALWLVVLVKLLLPPSFAIPSGIGWWLRPREVAPAKPPVASYVVTYGPNRAAAPLPTVNYVPVPAPRVRLSTQARALVGTIAVSLTLLIVMVARWRRLRRQLSKCQPAPIWLEDLVHDSHRKAGRRGQVGLMLTDASISPALCGLFRPVIVLPAALVNQLAPGQMRAVLLHELFHLRNGDVWVNCFQSLLQIVFWWHPFLWIANARIRRVREEVVDDSVRVALGEEAESYAPTLLEVARLALARPVATLGLVGILESRHALKQRVDRLVNFPAPGRVGLSIVSCLAILAFAGVALPMGQAPPRNVTPIRRQAPTVYNADQKLYYTFDQKFWDYFGSNGVDAVIQTFAQSDPSSIFLRYPNYPFVSQLESEPFNSQPGISNNDAAILQRDSPVETAESAGEFHPLTENGFIEYDLPPGMGTATNGAVVSRGGNTINADRITVNQQTREVFASGSVKIQSGVANSPVELEPVSKSDWIKYDAVTGTATATNGAVLREGDNVVKADNITFEWETGSVAAKGHPNMQLAQVQPSGNDPSRIIHTSSGRRGIMNKLEAIRLNHVAFDNLPMSEVVKSLRDEARKRDPEGKGINFLINPNSDTPPANAIDPATGLPVATPQVEAVDINGVSIRIMPGLEDVRMIDVLDAITKVADRRIRYSIEDYGVSFRLDGTTGPALLTRAIKVDPNVFAQGLESVVGVSVGNFQTGGQGGGGQQGNSSVTVPRVQVAPNGLGGQGGQTGAGGGQGAGGISGVTRPTAMITPQAVRQFIVNAGVNFAPPKSAFFDDRTGTLLVHGTMDDLDIIENALGALSTAPAAAPTTRQSQSTSRPVVPLANQTKVPVSGDAPVAGSDFQVKTVEVASASSPQQLTNAANGGTAEKLVTRMMKVNPETFRAGIRTIVPLPDHASPHETMEAFRKLLLDSGVELRPPANIFYNEPGASLFVRAIAAEMDAIEQMVLQLNTAPAQVTIQTRFVEVPAGDTNLIAIDPNANGPVITILTDPQYRAALHALEQRDGADLISESSVTTVSGRQAQVQNVDAQTIVKLNPQALVPPGVTSSNLLLPESLFFGPVLDIIPYVSDGDKIQLNVTAKVTEFLGYDPPESGDEAPVYVDGKPTKVKRPHPRTHVRTMQTASALIYDGQTVVLGGPKDEMITYDKEGKALSAPSTSKKNLLVFVTATLIDPAGNPVHRAGTISTTPERN